MGNCSAIGLRLAAFAGGLRANARFCPSLPAPPKAHRKQTNFVLFRFFAIANDYESGNGESMGMTARPKKIESRFRCASILFRCFSVSKHAIS
jgi:hypothetical protein